MEVVDEIKKHNGVAELTRNQNKFVEKLTNFWDQSVETQYEKDVETQQTKPKFNLILANHNRSQTARTYQSFDTLFGKLKGANSNQLSALSNPDLQILPDYVGEALKVLHNETRKIMLDLGRIFDTTNQQRAMTISSQRKQEHYANRFDCLPLIPQFSKVSLKGHSTPLLLKF